MEAFITKLIKAYGQKELRLHSSSAAFYIVVSALPLLAVLIFILSVLSPALLTAFEELLSSILPKEFYGGLGSVIVSFKESGLSALVPFSILASLWGSTKGVGGLCYGIEAIYGIKKERRLILRWLKTAWRTSLFYLIIICSLLIFAIGRTIPEKSLFVEIIVNLRIIIFALLLSVIFTLFYSRLANTSFKNHLFGGILAAASWMLFTYFYSLYVSYAVISQSIYAEVGTIIFFMLWVYFCVNIILIGAEINRQLID